MEQIQAMKSVVMVAYNFPPEGNAGAHRPLRLYDPSVLERISDGVEVIRVSNGDPWRKVKQMANIGNNRRLDRAKKTNPTGAFATSSGVTGSMIDFFRCDFRVRTFRLEFHSLQTSPRSVLE